MKDCNGTELFVGDEIVYTTSQWSGLIPGKVTGFTPKMVRITPSKMFMTNVNKDPSQVALYKRSETCSCEECPLPIHTYPDGHTRGMCQNCTEYRHDLPAFPGNTHH